MQNDKDPSFKSYKTQAKAKWNEFITKLKKELRTYASEETAIELKVRILEEITKRTEPSEENIKFISLHRKGLMSIDDSLLKKIQILDGFEKRDNLDNPVAKRIYTEIINSESIKNETLKLKLLKDQDKALIEEIERIDKLILGIGFDALTAIEYSKKYKFDPEDTKSIVAYGIIKSSKKTKKPIIRKTVQKENESPDIQEDITTPQEVPTEELQNYIERFNGIKNKYEKSENNNAAIIIKYATMIEEMNTLELKAYKEYSDTATDEQTIEQGSYDDAKSKVIAMQIIDSRKEIETMMETITNSNYSSKEDIDNFEKSVQNYKRLLKKLREIDNKITIAQQEMTFMDNPKVFFLIDKNGEPHIPDVIKEEGYEVSLLNFIQKAQADQLQKKKGIRPLKVNKKFAKENDRPVFAATNYKIVISYIQLNPSKGLPEGGIMILTSSLIADDTIQQETDEIIRENKDQIMREIELIEKGNMEEFGRQTIVRDEIIKSAGRGN